MTGRVLGLAMAWALGWALGLPSPAAAQEAAVRPGSAVLSGVVRDSLSGRPLGGARILMGGDITWVTTDPQGRFVVEVRPGEHTLGFSHRDAPSWSGLTHPVTVELDAGDTVSVELASAGEETVLDRTCGPGSKVVGGVVRDLLTFVPMAAAHVHVWALRPDGRSLVGTLRTSADGEYQSCVDPEVERVELQPRLGDAEGRAVQLSLEGRRVAGRELYVRASEPAQIIGTVVDGTTGQPLARADVEVLGTRLRALTGADGGFHVRGIPPGSIRLAVERLGYGRREVDLLAGESDTLRLRMEVFPEAIPLDSVVVEVRGSRLGETDRMGVRIDGMDRAEIERLLPRVVGFEGLLRRANVPGLRVREVEFEDRSGFRRPGVCVEMARRSSMRFDQCRMVEVYLNEVRIGDPESFLMDLDPNAVDRFRFVPPLEAITQYPGVRARHGVLLVWTRGN